MLDGIDLFLCRVGWRVGEWLVGLDGDENPSETEMCSSSAV